MRYNLLIGSDTAFSDNFSYLDTFKMFCGSFCVFFSYGYLIGFGNEPLVKSNGFFSDALIVNHQFQAVRLASVGQNKRHSPILFLFFAFRPDAFQIVNSAVYNGGDKGMISGGYALSRHIINIHKFRLSGNRFFRRRGAPECGRCWYA